MSTKLVDRFKERDDKIQAIVLNTFAALLRSSFLSSDNEESKEFQDVGLMRTRSSVEELHKHVDFFVRELQNILGTKNQTIKIAIMNVLLELSKTMSSEIAKHFKDFLPFMKKTFEQDTSSAIQIPAFQILQIIIGQNNPEQFKQFLEDILFMINKGIKCDHFGIIDEALRTVTETSKVLKIGGSQAQIRQLFDNVSSRIVQNDIEQEVKRSSIEAAGSMISDLYTFIDSSKIRKCIETDLISKLENEGSRIQSLKAFEKIVESSADISHSKDLIIDSIIPFVKM